MIKRWSTLLRKNVEVTESLSLLCLNGLVQAAI
jgi:hypothetical protein